MGVIAIVKMGQDFRLTLPKEVREMLRLEKGSELVFFAVEGFKARVCIRKK
ncbi:MAG: AbrB/MazE/SpoVT family DNA-binding domain-containing protein [Candidatus Bathyarchaeota archaeon]|jgi:AbrB family looped-hinge helix DNA binding protein